MHTRQSYVNMQNVMLTLNILLSFAASGTHFVSSISFSKIQKIFTNISEFWLRSQGVRAISFKSSTDSTSLNQAFPGWGCARNRLWSDRPRQVGPLIRPSQTEVISDQTSVRSKIVVRSKCARLRLWSDWSALEIASDQTEVRSKLPMIRLKCARNHLWSDKSALEITSDQTKVRSKLPLFRLKCVQNSPIREWFWTWTNLSITL